MSIQRGGVYFVDLNPVQGREQGGQRPMVALSIDTINQSPLVVTVVVGTKGANVLKDYPTNVRISPVESGLPQETVFLCFQIQSLDSRRFQSPRAGKLSDSAMQRLETTIRYCLGL